MIHQIGIIGMGVMGINIALNLEKNGFNVSIFNRSYKNIEKLIIKNNIKKKIKTFFSIKEFIFSLKTPRVLILMIKAGKGIDKIIDLIIPYIEKNDIIIDGGNTYYKDTIRRNNKLSKKGINFIGAGISGGELGALNGPSIMPGGQKSAYNIIKKIFKKIAARTEKGTPCVTYIGPDGAGHYVKMVHNGIEYGDMQLIAEVYCILKNTLNLTNNDLSKIFNKWNAGELNSYLIEITKNIFKTKDNKGNYLIDFILDEAINKGTGKWTSQSALELEEPLSLITESVFARYISCLKKQRIEASKLLIGPKKKLYKGNKLNFIEKIRRSLYFGKIISYTQGFAQLKAASQKYNWNLNYSNIAKIFRAGCIIRAKFLQKIINAYEENPFIDNLLLSPYFTKITNYYQSDLRYVVRYAIKQGIPVMSLSSAISYFDSYRSIILPTNLIQAQRDYFGAHSYKRIDKKGNFHTQWIN